MAGNALVGELPELPVNSSLQILNLKHNYLSGSIPNSYFQHRFSKIDLSSNKLTGQLREPIDGCDNIDYSLNRISGTIPSGYKALDHIKILNGNLFGCKGPRDLPAHDENSDDYTCGSDLLDGSMLAWVALLLLIVLLIIFVKWIMREKIERGQRHEGELNSFSTWSLRSSSFSESFVGVRHTTVSKVTSSAGWTLYEDLLRWYKLGIALTSRQPEQVPELSTLLVPPSQLVELSRFIASLLLIRSVGVVVAATVLILCTPMYLTIHLVGFSTHQNVYGWIITSGFTAGVTPAISFSLVWVWICILFAQLVSIGNGYVFGRTMVKKRMSHMAPNVLHTTLAADLAQYDRSQKAKVIAKSIGAVTLNAGIVLTLTSLYVVSQISDALSKPVKLLIQWVFTFMKLGWNALGVPACFSAMGKFQQSRKVMIYLLTLYFNNVLGLLFAAFAADDKCFSNALKDEPYETVEYDISICTRYNILRMCDDTEITTYESGFYAPYVYGYQCTNAILRTFLPLLFYAYTAVALLLPSVYLIMARIPKGRITSAIHMVLPSILWPDDDPAEGALIMMPNTVMINQISHLFVLLTFGITCPPLAIVIAVSVFSLCSAWIIVIGRYVERKLCRGHLAPSHGEAELNKCCNALHRTFRHSWSSPMDSVGVTLFIASIFYAVMIFDVIGDAEGVRAAILMSMCIVILLSVLQGTRSRRFGSAWVDAIGLAIFVDVPYKSWIISVLHFVSGLEEENTEELDRLSRITSVLGDIPLTERPSTATFSRSLRPNTTKQIEPALQEENLLRFKEQMGRPTAVDLTNDEVFNPMKAVEEDEC